MISDEQKWKETLKILAGSFINIKLLDDTQVVDFFNPSVKDFLCSYLAENKETSDIIFSGLYFTEQIYTLFSDSTPQKYYYWPGSSYIQVNIEQYDKVKQKVIELREDKRTCQLKKEILLTSKVIPYDELKFLLKIEDKFPIICRDNPGFLEGFVTQQMLEDNTSSVEDRLTLIDKLNQDYTDCVDTSDAIEKMQYDLGNLGECVEYVPVAKKFHRQGIIDSPSFHAMLRNLINNEIESVATEEDLGAVEDDIDKLTDLIPLFWNDFEDRIEEKREEIQQNGNEDNEDWRNSRYYGEIKEEENRIDEMFTSLRAYGDEE